MPIMVPSGDGCRSFTEVRRNRLHTLSRRKNTAHSVRLTQRLPGTLSPSHIPMHPKSVATPRFSAGIAHASCAAILVSAAACGIPTSIPDAPIVDQRWIVPSQSARFTVDNLLPSSVSIVQPDTSGFNVSAAAASVTRILSQDCSACVALNGLTAPKPAFVANATASTSLPTEIVTATVIAGSLNVTVQNNYTFDPLRPNPSAGSPNGYAVITVSNGASVIGKDSLNGANLTLPAGTTITRAIPVLGPITGAQNLTIALTMNSPVGEPRFIDASKTLVVTATPTALKVANVTVNVSNKTVSSTSTADLSTVDSRIRDDVQSGSLIVTLANPFTVAGTLTVKLTPAGGTAITKSVPLAAGNSTPAPIAFTQAELKSLLGRSVAISYSGVVNSPTPVNVSPKQAVVVTTKLDLSLKVGG